MFYGSYVKKNRNNKNGKNSILKTGIFKNAFEYISFKFHSLVFIYIAPVLHTRTIATLKNYLS